MSAQKHILLSTDLSDEAMESIQPILDLATAINARMTVLYVLPSNAHHAIGSPFVSPVPLPTDDEFLSNAKNRLEELRPRFPDCELAMEVRIGEDVPDAIIDYASENAVDIIAMTTHARTGLSRLVVGSIAETVIRHAKVPCFVVPRRD